MILYDYECVSCGSIEEHLVRSREEKVISTCCNSDTRRKFPLPALRTLNTTDKVKDALKKRSMEDSKKRREEYLYNAEKQLNKKSKKK